MQVTNAGERRPGNEARDKVPSGNYWVRGSNRTVRGTEPALEFNRLH